MKLDAPKAKSSTGSGASRATLAEARGSLLPHSSAAPPVVPDHQLLRLIGRGSYGEAWLARNIMGAWRAVKIIYRSSFEHDRPFEREFNGIRKFEPISRTHPSQLHILHVGRNDDAGYFYYVMELADSVPSSGFRVPGSAPGSVAEPQLETPNPKPETYRPCTLSSEIHSRGPLPVKECVEISLALTTALEHLHRHGLVHRDIKPSNIIFVQGLPKLADIGLVASVDATRSLVGTEGFTPPEGSGTAQADIYSLGKVLYEMSTGKDRSAFPEPPTQADETDRQSAEFNEIVLKACESDPRHRYQSCAEMRTELELLQRGQSVRRRRAVERRWAIGTKIGLAAAAVSLLLVLLQFVKFEPPGAHHSQRSEPNGNWTATREFDASAVHFSTDGRYVDVEGRIRVPASSSSRKSTPATEEASRLYQKGRFHFDKLTREDLQKAIDYMNQAIQIDPDFAPAYATLFEVFSWSLVPTADNDAEAHKFAKRLMEIDDTLPAARNAWGWARFLKSDWAGAEEEANRAISLDPNYATAHAYLGYYLTLQQRIEEAQAQMSLAIELDPASRIFTTLSGHPFYAARDYDRAIVQFRKALDLDANFFFARWWVGRTCEAKGDCIAAIAEFEKNALLAEEDRDRVKAKYDALRHAFATGGERGYWQKRLETGWFEPRGDIFLTNSPYYLAELHARLGDKERALDSLQDAYEIGDNIMGLKFHPFWDNLREEPRFKALLKKVRLGE